MFTYRSSPITFNNTVNGSTLFPHDKFVNDLGFVFDPKLRHNLDVEQVCCKAFKPIGFVKRVSAEFN